MTWNLAQTMSLIKAAQHKYTHRKLVGRDPKTNRPRYRYYYARHHGGGITGAKFEAGAAFKLTYKNRRGHFHIQRVEGDKVFVKHDGRPGAKEVEMSRDELRALLEKQHSKLETKSREKAQANRRKGRKKSAKRRKSTKRQAPKTATPKTTAPRADVRSTINEALKAKLEAARPEMLKEPFIAEGERAAFKQAVKGKDLGTTQHHKHRAVVERAYGVLNIALNAVSLDAGSLEESSPIAQYILALPTGSKGTQYSQEYRGLSYKVAEHLLYALDLSKDTTVEEFFGKVSDTISNALEPAPGTQTPREQVTEGADNFETMPEVEAPKSSARERELFNIVYDKTLDRKQAVKKRHRQAYLDLIEKRPIGGEERRALIELGREYTGILQQLINAVEIPGVSKGDTYAKLDAYAKIKGIAYTDRQSYNYAEAAFRAVIEDILKSGPNLDERRTRADFVRHVAQEIAAFEQAAQKQSAPSMEKVKAPAPPQAATTPTNGTVQRQSVLDAAEEAQRLDAQGGSKRSAAAIAADERLAETIRNLISNEYQGVEDVTRSDKPRRQWTVKERELNSLIDRLETLQSAKKKTRSMTAATAQNIRETTRGQLIDEMRRRIETDSRIKPTTQRSQTAQAFSGLVDAIKSGEGTQAAQRAFKTELDKVLDKTESGTLTDAERAELLPIAEQLVEATSGGARELMTAVRDQIKG